MAIVVVQTISGYNTSGVSDQFSLAFSAPVTQGNRLVAAISFYSSGTTTGIASVTDSLTNAGWTLLASSGTAVQLSSSLWMSPVLGASGPPPSVTVTLEANGGSNYFGLSLVEIAGLADTPLDLSATAADGGGTGTASFGITPPIGPTSAPGELVLGVCATLLPVSSSVDNLGWQTPVGFVNAYANSNELQGVPWSFVWRMAANEESESPIWSINTLSYVWSAALVTLKAATGTLPNAADPSLPPFPTLSPDQWAQRLVGLLPTQWTSDAAKAPGGVLYALMRTLGAQLNAVEQGLPFAWLNRSLLTAFGPTLDTAVSDFFGTALPRITAETDAAYRARALSQLFLPGATRLALSLALLRLTGKTPTIIEPWNQTDVSALGVGFTDTDGPYGLRYGGGGLPYQCFVETTLPASSANLGPTYGYDAGFFTDSPQGYMLDATPGETGLSAVYAAINAVKPEGVVVWTAVA